MSRRFVVLTAAAIALSSLAVASTIVRSGAQPYQTKADFDQAFASAGASSATVSAQLDAGKLRQAGLKRVNSAQ